ncbi:MAG TPA: hypothetical protein VF945_10870, partial [Polyangia bacterium]
MEIVTSFGDIKDELHKRSVELADDGGVLEPLIRELWIRASNGVPGSDVRLDSVEEVAYAFIERQQPASAAVEQVLRAGRALVEIGEGTDRLDAAAVTRLRQLVDRSAVDVGRAIESGRSSRR